MYKQLLVTATVVATLTSALGVLGANASQKDNTNTDKITICHGTNAANNPYVIETVSKSAANGGGHDDHTSHTGPVASSFAEATALKKSHTAWGDIIPAYTWNGINYPGLNWGTDGQSIYDNDCAYPVSEEQYAMIDYDIVCKVETQTAIVTFTNTGTKDGTVTLNDNPFTVTTSEPLVKNVAIATGGTQIKISIEEEPVLDQVYVCEPGKGSVNPTTPTPPAAPTDSTVTPAGTNSSTTDVAASLPYTAGNNTQLIAVIASAIAAMITIVSTIAKKAYLKQL